MNKPMTLNVRISGALSDFVSAIAGQRLDEIYRYTLDPGGDAQAEAYGHGLFECFDQIAKRDRPWRLIPAEFGVEGFTAVTSGISSVGAC